jgi:hypothetical protein
LTFAIALEIPTVLTTNNPTITEIVFFMMPSSVRRRSA